MPVTKATKHAIINELLNPTKSLEEVVRTYRDVCNEQMVVLIGDECGIDWELRAALGAALIRKDQLDAVIMEMDATFYEKVKRDDDDEDRPLRYRPYIRPRRI